MMEAVQKYIVPIKRCLPKYIKNSFINDNFNDVQWKLIIFLFLVSFDVEN